MAPAVVTVRLAAPTVIWLLRYPVYTSAYWPLRRQAAAGLTTTVSVTVAMLAGVLWSVTLTWKV